MQVIITVNLPVAFVPGKETEPRKCYRKTIVGDDIIRYQTSRGHDDRPAWVPDPKVWRKMNPDEKLRAFVETFNEGWGVSYVCVD